MTDHQRLDAISNAHAGRDFEADALEYFNREKGLQLIQSFSVAIGVAEKTKSHSFDFGSQKPAILVECKSHNWTATGNLPSAKITVWNEAMYYFHLAPKRFRKILFVLEARHTRRAETLAEYYTRINGHLIPSDVSIFEYNPTTKHGRYVKV